MGNCGGGESSAGGDSSQTISVSGGAGKKRDAYKLVLLGDKAVGKSSIVLRYTQDKFQDAHALTIGAAFVSKDLSIVSSSRGKNLVRLHIWDTAGEEAYRSMTRFFYREAEIGIVVYDVTNKLSFQHLDSWVNDFKEQCPDADVIIAGNKCDIPAQGRQVSLAEAEQFAADRGFVHIECSAKANINVQSLFGKRMAADWRPMVDEYGQTYYLHASGHSQWEYPAMQLQLPPPPRSVIARAPPPQQQQQQQQQFAMPQHSPYMRRGAHRGAGYGAPPAAHSPAPHYAHSPVPARLRSNSLDPRMMRSPMARPSPIQVGAAYSFTLARPSSAKRRPRSTSPRKTQRKQLWPQPPHSPRTAAAAAPPPWTARPGHSAHGAAAAEEESAWAEMHDEEGNLYYYNASTDESVWEKPANPHAGMGTRAHMHAAGYHSEHVGSKAVSGRGEHSSPTAAKAAASAAAGHRSDGELHITRRLQLEAENTSPSAERSGKRDGFSRSPPSGRDEEGEGEDGFGTPTTRKLTFEEQQDQSRRPRASSSPEAPSRAAAAAAATAKVEVDEKWRLALATEQARVRELRVRAESNASESLTLRGEMETLRAELARARNAVADMSAGSDNAEATLLRSELETCRASESSEAEAAKNEIVRRQEESDLALRECKAQANRAIAEWSSALDKSKKLHKAAIASTADAVASATVDAVATATATATATAARRLEEVTEAAAARLAKLEVDHRAQFLWRRELFNELQNLRGNVQVVCRCRPPLQEELDAGHVVAVEFPSEETLATSKKGLQGEFVRVTDSKGGLRYGRKKTFAFDRVFGPDADNTAVFGAVEPVVLSVLDGYNACIFAYGQTGSGKTYTMLGTPRDYGVIRRTVEHLFSVVEQRSAATEFTIEVEIFEFYNEAVRDLLLSDEARAAATKAAAKEGGSVGFGGSSSSSSSSASSASSSAIMGGVRKGKHGMTIEGMTRVAVEDVESVLALIARGQKLRAVARTNMNAHSSRSHLVISLHVTGVNRLAETTYRGKLHMIDLAGSERLSKSQAEGDRAQETVAINKSLLALGDVISARAKKQAHVPFRNSVLTFYLQDALSKNAKTLLIVQASPVDFNADETFCTFEFGTRARRIELKT